MNTDLNDIISRLSDREITSSVQVRPIFRDEQPKWASLMDRYHYLGFRKMIGERLQYTATIDNHWIGLLGWHAAALKNGPRDRWIGWHPQVRYLRLPLVANNMRYLLLPQRTIANLASRILALNLKRLADDWLQAYGHPVVLAETFVDGERFAGTCYRAANWIQLGTSRGYRKVGTGYQWHGSPKLVLVYPLRRNARAILRDPGRYPHWTKPPTRRTMRATTFTSLFDCLHGLPDCRKPRGKMHPFRTILTIALGAILCGARHYTAIAQWGQSLNQNQLRRIRARCDRRTKRYLAPSEPTIRRVLQNADVEHIDRVLGTWLLDHADTDDAIAIDGKTMRGAKRADGSKVHLLSAFLHNQAITVAQREVDRKTNEITQVRPLLDQVDIQGKVVTADAMHTQRDTATYLVEEKKADYIFIVKDNQPTLHDDLKSLDDEAFSPSARNRGEGTRQT